MNALSTYVRKIHNAGVAVRFDEIRKVSGDDAAIEYAARMLGPKRSEHEPEMKKLAAKDKTTAPQQQSTLSS